MTFDEAMTEAVQGARVTCDAIGEGVYVAYNFNGWRIHHGDMASSGFDARDALKEATWRIVETPCDHVFVEGAEGAFAGLTHHCVRCGVEAAPKPKPNVWGRPRIALGEAGVPPHNGMYPDAITTRIERRTQSRAWVKQMTGRATRPNVGTSPAPSGFELARLEAAKESEPLPEPAKPVSKWGWGKK